MAVLCLCISIFNTTRMSRLTIVSLTSALDGGEWSALYTWRFASLERKRQTLNVRPTGPHGWCGRFRTEKKYLVQKGNWPSGE